MTDKQRAGRPSTLRLLIHQFRYQNQMFWRYPTAAFFTLAFPLMFFFVFTTVFGNDVIPELGVTRAPFYAPALAVYGAVAAAYYNLAVSTVARRGEGILKRVRGTPIPPWIYIAGRLASTTWIAFLAIVLMLGVGGRILRRPGLSRDAGGCSGRLRCRRRVLRRTGDDGRFAHFRQQHGVSCDQLHASAAVFHFRHLHSPL